jgi:DNA damage-binding protein 1
MTSVPSMFVRAVAQVDGTRYLIGDDRGGLHILALEEDNNTSNGKETSTSSPSSSSSSSSTSLSDISLSFSNVTDLRVEKMGETSCASAISYLDNGIVFVGSSLGDSQLIRLSSSNESEDDNDMVTDSSSSSSGNSSNPVSSDEPPTLIHPIEEFQNIGPILDFTLVDAEKQGQAHIVSCSGAFKDGSLRVVRNGIGIEEEAALEMEGIKGMWSLRGQWSDEFDQYLVMTFRKETHVLGIDGAEMGEVDIPGMEDNLQTLSCTNTV